MPDEIILTESSYKQLQSEIENLKTVKRAEIADALRKARAYGDLSENFEYHAARREQGILNGKIAEKERILEIAKVVPDEVSNGDGIGLGSVVMVMEDGAEWEFTIVDSIQADPMKDLISVHSPVAKAMMGKKAGETVTVQAPDGEIVYEIISVT